MPFHKDARGRPLTYKLVGHDVEPCTVEEWGEQIRRIDLRRVAIDTLPDGSEVSTVFTGTWTNLDGPPELFETMLSGPLLEPDGGECYWHWATWAEAEAGHAAVLGVARDLLEESKAGDGA